MKHVDPFRSSWKDDYGDGLTAEDLYAKYSPTNKLRVSRYQYEAGTEVSGSMIAGRCFVFSGVLMFSCRGSEVTLKSGEYGDIPAGSFSLKVGDDCDADLVYVWRIPSPRSRYPRVVAHCFALASNIIRLVLRNLS